MNKIIGWLLKGHVRRIAEQYKRNAYNEVEAYKASLDVKDIVRERLKGVRPNHPDDTTRLQNLIASMDDVERLAFLSKAQDIVKSKAFQEVSLSLIIESEHKAMLHATSMEEVNFNRATINGIALLQEEFESLSTMYSEEKDSIQKLSEEDRHAIIG